MILQSAQCKTPIPVPGTLQHVPTSAAAYCFCHHCKGESQYMMISYMAMLQYGCDFNGAPKQTSLSITLAVIRDKAAVVVSFFERTAVCQGFAL